EKNGGRHGWAKLGATLGATSTFTGPKGRVGMRLLGAPKASRIDFENGAAYAASSYTAVQVFHGKSFKESIVVPKRLGTRDWAWKASLPKGRKPSLTANGGVNLGVGLFVPAPVITKADGTPIKTDAAWAVRPDGTLTMRVDDRRFPLPYIVDPGIVPEVSFTGFSAATGNTYVDPTYALTRIFINSSQSGSFTANAAVHDPDDALQHEVCFPAYGAGWTSDGGCIPGTSGVAQPGILATYYSGSTTGTTYPGAAFTTNNNGANCANNAANPIGPFSRIEQGIDSWSFWGNPGINDDAPYSELCDERFSARWRGAIRTGTAGAGASDYYWLGTITDDGIRVRINGVTVLADWSEHGPQWNTSCRIKLAPDTTYPIEVEYFENAGNNRAKLFWAWTGSGSTPAGGANQATSCYDGPNPEVARWNRTATTGSAIWSPSGVNNGSGTSPWAAVPAGTTTTPGLHMPSNTFARTYSWNPGAATPTPASQDIIARDQLADPTPGTTPFTVIADGTGPTGGSIAYDPNPGAGPWDGAPAIQLDIDANGTTDGTAGLVAGIKDPTAGQVRRQETTYANGVCGSWPTTWDLGPGVTTTGATITTTTTLNNDLTRVGTLSSGSCYRWALSFEDNVGNWGASAATAPLRVDTSTPANSAVTLTEGTNPDWMHVVGTTLWYNNGASNTGTFTVDIAASDPESGVDDVTFPGFGAGWVSGTGASTDNTSPYVRTYSWQASSTQPAANQVALVEDNATNVAASLPFNVRRDVSAPTGGSVTYTNGMWGSSSHAVAFNTGTDGTGAGIATWQLERREATLQPDGSCGPYPAAWTPVGPVDPPGASWTNPGLIAGTCYQWRLQVTDHVGNAATPFASANELKFDDVPPTVTFLGVNEVSGGAYVYHQPLTSRVWFNPAFAGSFRAQVTAADPLGVAGVDFPVTGATNWTGPTPTFSAAPIAASTYESAPYAWTATGADPATLTVVATDPAANAASTTFDIDPDTTAPSGGAASPPNGAQQSLTVPITVTTPTDAQSGVASWRLLAQQGTLTNGSCSAWGGVIATGVAGAGTPPASITQTAPGNGCYRTQLETTDNVGNVDSGTASTDVVQVDRSNPAVAITGPAVGSAQTGTFTISGTGAEGHTALANVGVTFSGPSSGTACASATLTPSGAGTWTWTCSWATPAVDGTYTITITGTDSVGNVGTTTTTYLVDNVAPVASFTRWTESSSSLHSPGGADANLLWYNPSAPAAGSGTATAVVTATDAGAGMQGVDFPALAAAGWSGSGTDTTPTSDEWSFGYTFTGGGAIGNPATTNAVARDNAGATTGSTNLDFRIEPDATAPPIGSQPALSGMQTTTSFSSTFTVGTDTESGVGRWAVDLGFAPLIDGTCGAWDPWTDGVATPGFNGSTTNGSTVSLAQYLNDANFDGTPEMFDAFCMRIQVRVFDNVGNVSTIAPNGHREFDFANPVVAVTTPATGSDQSGTFTVSGTADDAHVGSGIEYPLSGSGLADVVLTYSGPASGTICTTSTFGGTWTAATWGCPWVTGALPDGLYTVSAVAHDRAGRSSTISTATYRLDNQAPVIAWHSWDDTGSGAL
ncbi:MAG: Laminin sub domain 2, partial [Thermoleophilia bacterium]|nr:Laminin sub domain 2 [Thermoleophilia bacterium]